MKWNLFRTSISLEFLKHLSPIIVSLYGFHVFPMNKCSSAGSRWPHVWEGRIHGVFGLPAWNPFPFHCVEYVTFCQSHYFSKKRLFSAHCMTIAALWKHPRSLCSQLIDPKSVSLPWKADCGRCASSLRIYRVLWEKSFFRYIARKPVLSGDLLASPDIQNKSFQNISSWETLM